MKYDYGEYTPDPPSAEAIAIRDQLAEELVVATKRLADELALATSKGERKLANGRWRSHHDGLVLHMLDVGLPLEDFSTPNGHPVTIQVKVSDPKPKPGMEAQARSWLAKVGMEARKGRDGRKSEGRAGKRGASVAQRLKRNGGSLPEHLFEPLSVRVTARAA